MVTIPWQEYYSVCKVHFLKQELLPLLHAIPFIYRYLLSSIHLLGGNLCLTEIKDKTANFKVLVISAAFLFHTFIMV